MKKKEISEIIAGIEHIQTNYLDDFLFQEFEELEESQLSFGDFKKENFIYLTDYLKSDNLRISIYEDDYDFYLDDIAPITKLEKMPDVALEKMQKMILNFIEENKKIK